MLAARSVRILSLFLVATLAARAQTVPPLPGTFSLPAALDASLSTTVITWAGGTGAWGDPTQWIPQTVPNNTAATQFTALVNSGSADLNTTVALAGLLFTGGTIHGASSLTLHGLGSAWNGGSFAGPGEVIIASGAQLMVSGANAHDFSGRTLRNQGAFIWTDRGSLQSGNGGAFINAPGGTFVDATLGSSDHLIANSAGGAFSLSNAGNFIKTTSSTTHIAVPFSNSGNVFVSSGTLRFSDTFTHTSGLLSVSAWATARFDRGLVFGSGTLHGGGTIAAHVTHGGLLSPGDEIGRLTIEGNLTLLATSRLLVDIRGAGQGTTYDFLSVTGTATLGGDLNLQVPPGHHRTLLPSDSFIILSASSLFGTFANAPAGSRITALDGSSFLVNYTGSSVVLSQFSPIPEPSTWVLLIMGGAVLVAATLRPGRRQRSSVAPPSMS